jgi:hypothetical protein
LKATLSPSLIARLIRIRKTYYQIANRRNLGKAEPR